MFLRERKVFCKFVGFFVYSSRGGHDPMKRAFWEPIFKYIYELSVEDVLKQKVCHRPDIFKEGKVTKFVKSSYQKNLGLIYTEPQY